MKVKEETEKVGLKFIIQKTKIMASGPITSWQIDGETVTDFIFLGSKITADGDCSHEIKRHLLLGRKVMTNLDSVLKSRGFCIQNPKFCIQNSKFNTTRIQPGIEPRSPALQVDSLPTSHLGRHMLSTRYIKYIDVNSLKVK